MGESLRGDISGRRGGEGSGARPLNMWPCSRKTRLCKCRAQGHGRREGSSKGTGEVTGKGVVGGVRHRVLFSFAFLKMKGPIRT